LSSYSWRYDNTTSIQRYEKELEMRIPLALAKLDLVPGKPFAATIPEGARIRVVAGTIWATTSGSPEDTWLQPGEEHQVPKGGLTVLEAAGTRSTVELLPRLARDQGSIVRAICVVAAFALSALTLTSLVILPAEVAAPGARMRAAAVLNAQTETSYDKSAAQGIAQNGRARSSTQVEERLRDSL
jgi:hypothetical protein